MPQVYDMEPTAHRAEDFFRPEKSWRLRPGLNPRTRVLKGTTLLLDHQSRSQYLYHNDEPVELVYGKNLLLLSESFVTYDVIGR